MTSNEVTHVLGEGAYLGALWTIRNPIRHEESVEEYANRAKADVILSFNAELRLQEIR